MPMEVKMMRKMEETGCPSVVRYIAYRRFLHDQVHRIYMEYCPHGDLRRLYKRYRMFRFVCPRTTIVFEVLILSRLYMPEPFLWDVFHHLVEAAVAMRNGPADGGWDGHEIVHRDIKPGNSPSPEFFPLLLMLIDISLLGHGGQEKWDSLSCNQVGRLGSCSANRCQ